MQIVIDISEKEYNYYRDASNFWGYSKLREIILNGIPLPKGHGRLIDADECRKEIDEEDRWVVDLAETIVEADKEVI